MKNAPMVGTWFVRENHQNGSPTCRANAHPTDLVKVESVTVNHSDHKKGEIVFQRFSGRFVDGQPVFERKSIMSFHTWWNNKSMYTACQAPKPPMPPVAESKPAQPASATIRGEAVNVRLTKTMYDQVTSMAKEAGVSRSQLLCTWAEERIAGGGLTRAGAQALPIGTLPIDAVQALKAEFFSEADQRYQRKMTAAVQPSLPFGPTEGK